MRRSVLLLILALIVVGPLGAVSHASDIPAGRLIVPGVRIGPWTLTMGIAGLRHALGGPLPAPPRPMFDQQTGLTGYAWTVPDGTLTTWSRDGATIGYLELRDSRSYRTVESIGVGSSSLQTEAAYGPPTARSAIPGASRYIYDRLGFAVFTQGTSSGFLTVAVSVFRPGSAAQLWKF